jgi:hypothetical protein
METKITHIRVIASLAKPSLGEPTFQWEGNIKDI